MKYTTFSVTTFIGSIRYAHAAGRAAHSPHVHRYRHVEPAPRLPGRYIKRCFDRRKKWFLWPGTNRHH
jgi:hypothetical protein